MRSRGQRASKPSQAWRSLASSFDMRPSYITRTTRLPLQVYPEVEVPMMR